MIDINLQATVSDDQRRFDLAVRFATDLPVVALYGPSGAGKSLTLQAIAGLLQPHVGHVRIGQNTLFDSLSGCNVPSAKRRIGYLFQNYALFPHMSVRQNIGFGLTNWYKPRPASAQQEKIDALLESFGLQEMADSRPKTLSGGQQQRVALARALACEPQLLLLDEPFAALNPMLRAALRLELAQVRRQWDIPMIMITHDVDDVLALADIVFVYEQGQITQEIDLRTAERKDHARMALTQQPALPPNSIHERVRALLSAG